MNKSLGVVVSAILFFRLYLSFSSPTFESSSYFDIRQIEYIHDNYFPMTYDEQSALGRDNILVPGFYILMAIISFLLPFSLTLKLIPQLFFVATIGIGYYVAYELSHHKMISLFIAVLLGFLPVYFTTTIFRISPIVLFIPLMLLSLYFFFRISIVPQSVLYFIGVMALLPLVSPASMIVVASYLFYCIVARIEKIPLSQKELEAILFSTVFCVWITFILYKKAFLLHGLQVVWQNIPLSILETYFTTLDPIDYIAFIGLLPLVFGAKGMYDCLFTKKSAKVYLLLSIGLMSFIALILKLIQPLLGLTLLGVVLTLICARSLRDLYEYLTLTKIQWLSFLFTSVCLIIASVSILVTLTFSYSPLSNHTYDAYQWLNDHSDSSAVIAAPLEDGHLITAISKRASVIDDRFLMTDLPSERLVDLLTLSTNPLEVEQIRITEKYGVDFIVVPGQSKTHFTNHCFTLVYDSDILIYKVTCEVSVV